MRLFQNPPERRVRARDLQDFGQEPASVGPLPSAGGVLKKPPINTKIARYSEALPYLGPLPLGEAGAGLVPCEPEGNNHERYLQENSRIIRTNLALGSSRENPIQVLMVTNALPQEGKTMVSSRLAYSMAQRGDRTLLIDTDLRRKRVHQLFGLPRGPELPQVLSGELPLAAACRI